MKVKGQAIKVIRTETTTRPKLQQSFLKYTNKRLLECLSRRLRQVAYCCLCTVSQAFHSDHEVKNYPMKERTQKELEELERVQCIRKIENTDCNVSCASTVSRSSNRLCFLATKILCSFKAFLSVYDPAPTGDSGDEKQEPCGKRGRGGGGRARD